MKKEEILLIPKIEKQYRSYNNFSKKYDAIGRQHYFQGTSLLEFQRWKEKSKDELFGLLGLEKMQTCALDIQVEEIVYLKNGITREKVVIQTEPEVYMPMYILIPPKKNGEKLTCFIAPCGHQGGGKYSVAGCDEFKLIKEKIDFFQYDYGMQLAKRGFVAICPDARGFGERKETAIENEKSERFFESSCYALSHMAESLGETVIGMLVWDLMRVIDYVEKRDEWRLDNLGCLGFSGGGMQTLWLGALDSRVKQAVISGYLYGYKDSLLQLNANCNCNYVPHLMEYYDMGDVASLLAPRPVTIQSCTNDHLNGCRGIENVEEQLRIVNKAYTLYEKESKLTWDVCKGRHSWHEENLSTFLRTMGNEIYSEVIDENKK